jgi:hypothetical protein
MLTNRWLALRALAEARAVALETKTRLDRLDARLERVEGRLLRIILRLFGTEAADGEAGH